jgi:uncharacterized protein
MGSRSFRWLFLDQNFILLPQKAIFWEEEEALIIADLHIGKVGHFRKAGIAIPKLLEQEELAELSDLIADYKPQKIIFLGDLFHSDINNDWNWLQLWRDLYPSVQMILVEGNHDILNAQYYYDANFDVCKEFILGPFRFIHDDTKKKQVESSSSHYVLSGHVHPAVRLRGRARQSLLLSCFYFGKSGGILPAFGKFTGKYCLDVDINDSVFGISGKEVMKLNLF